MEILHKPNLEDWFLIWMKYLVDHGYVHKYVHKHGVPSFVLFDQFKIGDDTLLKKGTYKPDGVIYWNSKAEEVFYTELKKNTDLKTSCYFLADKYENDYPGFVSYIEIKAPPGYGKGNMSDAAFAQQQKWLWQKYRTYVNKIFLWPTKKVLNERPYLWPSTFTPLRYMFSDKTLVPRTIPNKAKSKKDPTRIAAWVPRMWEEFLKLKQ